MNIFHWRYQKKCFGGIYWFIDCLMTLCRSYFFFPLVVNVNFIFTGPMNCSLPISSIHRILQTRILEWSVMRSSSESSRPRDLTWVSCIAGRFFTTKPLEKTWYVFKKSLSHVQLFATPWTAACKASLSITNSRSLLKLMSIESMMPSNHLMLCCPLLFLQSFPSSGSFPVSQFFASDGQNIGVSVSASASVHPKNIQDWFL